MEQNWFDRGGADYARYRPEYPASLAAYLAAVAPSTDLAVDVGCGTGQLTTLLADHFDTTLGIDPGAEQIANATPRDGVRYLHGPAERLPVPDRCAALITAAQAAHWFDRSAYYEEVRRIAIDGAVLALISYGVMRWESDLQHRFDRFYRDEIGPYWPPERALVDSGYAGIEFPFDEFAAPPMSIEKDWNLDELLGYLSTWSAVRRAERAGRADVLRAFATDLTSAWGDPARTRRISWPVTMRIGVVG